MKVAIVPEAKMLNFPAATFLTFFINHKLLQVNYRPVWKTVKNGSIQYVRKVLRKSLIFHLGTAVQEVERINSKVKIKTSSDVIEFDRVIMATHAPITARILKMQTDHEYQKRTSKFWPWFPKSV